MDTGPQLLTIQRIERWKKAAKRLRKAGGVTHLAALDGIAIQKGYPDWRLLIEAAKRAGVFGVA